MEQQNNSAVVNDTAGVLPMDAGVTANGIHDESENNLSSSNAGAKKGRGRPPKSAGSTKASVNSDTPKRARGRPPKSGDAAVAPSPPKKVVSPIKNKEEEPSTNGDDKKKRGRPSKTSTPSEQTNGISKPQVRSTPVTNYREVEEDFDEPTKKKRGRPSGASPKKAAVVTEPSSAPKEASSSSTKKRGRPSGTTSAKKPASKPKVSVSDDGSAKKRGRPKKAAGSPTPAVAAAAASPVNETAVTVTPTAVQ